MWEWYASLSTTNTYAVKVHRLVFVCNLTDRLPVFFDHSGKYNTKIRYGKVIESEALSSNEMFQVLEHKATEACY